MVFALHPLISGAISFALLAGASWCVGEGGEILGKKYDASVIGGLLIAWLNTAPETIFFISALRANNARFAVGAVSGSTIVVGTVAVGVCIYLGSRARKTGFIRLQPAVKSQALVLALTSLIPLLTVLFGFTYSLSFLGVAVYLAFLIHTLLQSRKTQHPHSPHDLEQASGHVEGKIKESVLDGDEDGDDSDEEEDDDNTPTWKGFGYLALGGSLIFIFSEPFINAVSALATMMDVNSTLLAFFLAPIASEMPEILESISLSRKGNPTNINIAFSNLVGGTITKTTLLMGIFSMYGLSMPIVYESPSFSISLVLMIICSIACGFIGYLGYRLSKKHAYLLFGLFIITCIVQYMANSQFGQSLMPLSSSPN